MSVSSVQAKPFPPLPVTAAGMATALGGLTAGCAASRAGILRISEIPPPETSEESESPYSGHRVPDLPSDLSGMERLAHLGARALEDLFSGVQDPAAELGRYALILCLPSGYLEWAQAGQKGETPDAFASGAFVDPSESTRMETVKTQLLSRLFSLLPQLPHPAWTGLVLEDQAGFAEGVSRAAALLAQGRIETCLLGGMDSRIGWETMKAMDEMGLIMTTEFPHGFLPGEGGAFLLLKGPGAPGEPLAYLESAAQAAETNHRLSPDPPLGEALTQAALGALANAGGDGGDLYISGSINGSPWNSNEWGYLLFRVRELGAVEPWLPAADFGDAGAVLGHLSACGVLRGFARGYITAPRAILLLSSECGRKGAVVMRKPPSPGEGS